MTALQVWLAVCYKRRHPIGWGVSQVGLQTDAAVAPLARRSDSSPIRPASFTFIPCAASQSMAIFAGRGRIAAAVGVGSVFGNCSGFMLVALEMIGQPRSSSSASSSSCSRQRLLPLLCLLLQPEAASALTGGGVVGPARGAFPAVRPCHSSWRCSSSARACQCNPLLLGLHAFAVVAAHGR